MTSSAARILGRAFTTDPLNQWLLEGRPDLEGRLTTVFGAFADVAQRKGGEVLVGPHGTTAAVWLPPGRWRTPLPDVLRSGPAMARVFGRRLPRALATLAAVERAHPGEPHWYLEALGTVPEARGQGHGSAVVQPVLDRCDDAGLPAYLESSNPRNIPFYERHGFRTMPLFRLPRGCPVVTPMWRAPR